ncbi:unnamed protein product [Rotaria sp. Silwood1]|nr:unnamed protein product [Rotaria sp. Silwood1]
MMDFCEQCLLIRYELFKTLPLLQKQIDAILHFDITPNQLTNSVIHNCFFLLTKDLIYLYAAYNEGIINLLEKSFNMNKKQCREALDMYKKFLDRTDQVSQYLKISERYEQLFDRRFWEGVILIIAYQICFLLIMEYNDRSILSFNHN